MTFSNGEIGLLVALKSAFCLLSRHQLLHFFYFVAISTEYSEQRKEANSNNLNLIVHKYYLKHNCTK